MMKSNTTRFHKGTKKSFNKELLEWMATMGITTLAALFILGNVFSLTEIEGKSMEPTFSGDERVFNYKLGYNFIEPKRGEIIILNKLESRKGIIINIINEAKDIINNISNRITKKEEVKYIIKRIAAIPGDAIDIKDGNVYLNGKILGEKYIKGKTFEYSDFSYPLIVPENKVFVLGDNRENSLDSRRLGLIDYEQIKGKVTFKLWPFEKFGKVD